MNCNTNTNFSVPNKLSYYNEHKSQALCQCPSHMCLVLLHVQGPSYECWSWPAADSWAKLSKAIAGKPMQFRPISADSGQFRQIPGNSGRFRPISGDFGKFRRFWVIPDISGDSRHFLVIPGDSRHFGWFRAIPGDSGRFRAIPGDSGLFRAIPAIPGKTWWEAPIF